MAHKRKSKYRVSKKGLPPGSKIYTGHHPEDNVTVDVYLYNPASLHHRTLHPEQIKSEFDPDHFRWINITGVHDGEVIKNICEKFDIHFLHQEDIMNIFQRPKTEEENHYNYTVMKMVIWDDEKNEVNDEQVSFFLTRDTLLTFQEREGDLFWPIRERLKDPNAKVRNKKIDYLFYLLIDIIVDQYFEVVDKLGEKLEKLEDNIISRYDEMWLTEIQSSKKDLILMRRVTYPIREILLKLMRNENHLIEENNIRYLRDIYDHTIQILDTIDSYREINVSLKDIYLNTVSHELNKVMKMLTIISTVFIPLTFIVGVYGMNFDVMPELRWTYGYALVWCIMILIVIGLIVYFRRKKWL